MTPVWVALKALLVSVVELVERLIMSLAVAGDKVVLDLDQ